MTFEQLTLLATPIVEATQRRLPVTVRDAASRVPVSFEPVPNSALIADGLAPDILGLFVGSGHPGSGGEIEPLPSQILLFLVNLWDFAGENEAV